MKFVQTTQIEEKSNNGVDKKVVLGARKPSIFSKLKTKKLLLVIPVLIIFVLAFSFYYFIWGKPRNVNKINSEILKSDFKLIEAKILREKLEDMYKEIYFKQVAVRDKVNPLNGVLLTTDEYKEMAAFRPIMVVTDNHQQARPQSGLSDSDITYEVPVEGGITRILALYWSKYPASFGPIRSFRPYMGDIAQEYDALVYHIGQSVIDPNLLAENPELKAFDSPTYFSQNNIARTSCGYYRDQVSLDNKVAIEHTAYVDVTKIRSCVDKSIYTKPVNVTSLKYKADANLEDRSNSSIASINNSTYSSGSENTSKWVYDKLENVYLRLVGSEKQIDRNNSLDIKVKNVIIQEVTIGSNNNSNGRVSVGLIGQGKAKILRDGKVIEATWQKDNVKSRTKYLDTAGKEIEFNRGKTWVNFVAGSGNYEVR